MVVLFTGVLCVAALPAEGRDVQNPFYGCAAGETASDNASGEDFIVGINTRGDDAAGKQFSGILPRTNELSHKPGGCVVVVVYHDGRRFEYDDIKDAEAYIKKTKRVNPEVIDAYIK